MLKKKSILPLTAVLLFGSSLISSCDFNYQYSGSESGGDIIISGGDSVSMTGESINFMVYQPSNQDHQRALQNLIAEFVNETGIQVRLNAVPKDSYDATFRASFRGQYVPDLAYMDQPLIATYASDGEIIAIDDYLNDLDLDLTAFNQAALATNIYEGKTYGLPLNLTASVLFYNKALLSDEDAPSTWEEWLSTEVPAETALFEGVGAGGYAGWYFQAFIENCGGSLYDETTGQVAFNSAEGIEAAQFLKDLYRNDLDSTIRNSSNAFINGDIVYKIGSSYDIDNMRAQNPNLDLGAVVMPSKDGTHHYSVMGGENLVIPTRGKNHDAAMRLMEFLLEEENMKLLGSFTGNFPSITEYQETDDPVKQVIIDQFDELLMRPIVPGWMEVNDLYLGEAIGDILDHEQPRDISEALTWAEAAANQVLARA